MAYDTVYPHDPIESIADDLSWSAAASA